ncbi:MAG: hypothetical protein HY235_16140 [Acidobacteria bacterium]|nr:hypothetical protein [Acidobacteriota bacterium]
MEGRPPGRRSRVRPYGSYGAVVFKGKETLQSNPKAATGYRPMLVEIVKFFETGAAPVAIEDSIEIFAFMDAALRSKQAGGRPAPLR